MLDFMTQTRDGCRDDEIKMLFRFWMGFFFLDEDLNQYVVTESQNGWVWKGPLKMI